MSGEHRLQPPPAGTSDTTAEPLVSVVVPALNERRHIAACLESLQAQEWPKDRLEIILVDNGSTDGTVEVAAGYQGSLALTILVLPKVTIATLRNVGVRNSRGEIVAFLDADCTVGRQWLRAGVARVRHEKVGVAGCSHAIPDGSSWVAKAWHQGIEKKRVLGERTCLPSGNMFVSKATFTRVGGFDESLKTNEDYELCLRYRKHGFVVYSDPAIEARHLGIPATLREFFLQQRWHGIHVMKVFLRNLGRTGRPADLGPFKAALYGLYSMFMHLWLASEILILLFSHGQSVRIIVPAAGLLAPAFFLALQMAKGGKGGPIKTLQLILLCYLYGLARATSSAMFWEYV